MVTSRFNNEVHKSTIVELLRPSPIFAFVNVFPLLIVSLITLFLAATFQYMFIFISVILVIMAFYRYLYISRTRYILNDDTIVVRTGIIARKFENLELFRVKDFTVSQSVFERIFGLMTVTIHTSDLSTAVLKMQGVPLSNITETIRALVQKARLNNRIFEIS